MLTRIATAPSALPASWGTQTLTITRPSGPIWPLTAGPSAKRATTGAAGAALEKARTAQRPGRTVCGEIVTRASAPGVGTVTGGTGGGTSESGGVGGGVGGRAERHGHLTAGHRQRHRLVLAPANAQDEDPDGVALGPLCAPRHQERPGPPALVAAAAILGSGSRAASTATTTARAARPPGTGPIRDREQALVVVYERRRWLRAAGLSPFTVQATSEHGEVSIANGSHEAASRVPR